MTTPDSQKSQGRRTLNPVPSEHTNPLKGSIAKTPSWSTQPKLQLPPDTRNRSLYPVSVPPYPRETLNRSCHASVCHQHLTGELRAWSRVIRPPNWDIMAAAKSHQCTRQEERHLRPFFKSIASQVARALSHATDQGQGLSVPLRRRQAKTSWKLKHSGRTLSRSFNDRLCHDYSNF